MSDPALQNLDLTLARRFGVSTGLPSVWNAAGDHVIAHPSPGRHTRLKWIALYSDPGNAGSCLVTIKWAGSSGNIYLIPFPAGASAFMHSSVREGAVDEDLIINLSGAQTIYVTGIDVEEF